MKIHISTAKPRKKLEFGDRKMIKGVLHERQMKRAYDRNGNVIGFDCTGGRQNVVWKPVETTDID
jgi:hypothetical protein